MDGEIKAICVFTFHLILNVFKLVLNTLNVELSKMLMIKY